MHRPSRGTLAAGATGAEHGQINLSCCANRLRSGLAGCKNRSDLFGPCGKRSNGRSCAVLRPTT